MMKGTRQERIEETAKAVSNYLTVQGGRAPLWSVANFIKGALMCTDKLAKDYAELMKSHKSFKTDGYSLILKG
jgi:hypothetical protein